jgi:hypothetical protein
MPNWAWNIKVKEILANLLFFAIVALLVLLVPYATIRSHIIGGPVENYSDVANTIGIIAVSLAALVVFLNIYLSFIRPSIYRFRHGTLDGFGNISGLPVVGTILVLLAAFFLAPNKALGILLLILFVVDTGGLPCFLFVMAREFMRDRVKA